MFTMMFGISKDRFVYDYILSNQNSLQTTEKTKTKLRFKRHGLYSYIVISLKPSKMIFV